MSFLSVAQNKHEQCISGLQVKYKLKGKDAPVLTATDSMGATGLLFVWVLNVALNEANSIALCSAQRQLRIVDYAAQSQLQSVRSSEVCVRAFHVRVSFLCVATAPPRLTTRQQLASLNVSRFVLVVSWSLLDMITVSASAQSKPGHYAHG
jgi:hypothetical protein